MMTTADRTHYRTLVAQVAEKAKAKLPECNGRVDKAVALVLAGDVEAQEPDGSWRVGSCTDPLTTHRVRGTSCSCDDSQHGRAPHQLCKHVLATMIHLRVQELLPPPQPQDATLPEAPASINFKALVGQFEVQFTLRGQTEAAVFERLQTLLKRPEIKPVPKPAPRSGNWKPRQPYQGH